MQTKYISEPKGRLIAIGDIHGQSHILKMVLDGITPQEDDVIVFLGDLINRGNDSKGVLDQILNLNCEYHVVMGNHEEMLLGALLGGESDIKFWKKFGGIETLASYGVETAKEIPRNHLKLIADANDYCESDKFIFVHSFCHPHIPLEKNTSDVLRWMKLPDEDFNFPIHDSGKTVVCGHSAQKQILDLGHLICIDTGCGIWSGGRLTAIDLKSGEIWQAGGRNKKATLKSRQSLQNRDPWYNPPE